MYIFFKKQAEVCFPNTKSHPSALMHCEVAHQSTMVPFMYHYFHLPLASAQLTSLFLQLLPHFHHIHNFPLLPYFSLLK